MIDRVLIHEGGYSNDPADRGSETNFGISKASYPDLDIKALTKEGAIQIYRRDFWDSPGLSRLPSALGFQVLDASINQGLSRSIQWLQFVVGAKIDGVLGNETLAKLSGMPLESAVMAFIARRGQDYLENRQFSSFGHGWLTRLNENIQYAAQDFR